MIYSHFTLLFTFPLVHRITIHPRYIEDSRNQAATVAVEHKKPPKPALPQDWKLTQWDQSHSGDIGKDLHK
jgi:hypothetical protein